jgi:hypothetical protein
VVGEEAGDGLVGVALGVADEADGAALDPPDDVRGGKMGAVAVQDPAGLVRDGAGDRVEGARPHRRPCRDRPRREATAA